MDEANDDELVQSLRDAFALVVQARVDLSTGEHGFAELIAAMASDTDSLILLAVGQANAAQWLLGQLIVATGKSPDAIAVEYQQYIEHDA